MKGAKEVPCKKKKKNVQSIVRRQKYTEEAYMWRGGGWGVGTPPCTFTRSILANCKPTLYNARTLEGDRRIEKVAVGRLEGLVNGTGNMQSVYDRATCCRPESTTLLYRACFRVPHTLLSVPLKGMQGSLQESAPRVRLLPLLMYESLNSDSRFPLSLLQRSYFRAIYSNNYFH